MDWKTLSVVTVIVLAVTGSVATVAAESCGEMMTVDLITSNGIEVGTVMAGNDGTTLGVAFVAGSTWLFVETELIVGAGGRVKKYVEKHERVREYIYRIPLEWPPGTELELKTDARVVRTGEEVTRFQYEVQACEPQPGQEGCTPGYWKNHADAWGPTGYDPGQQLSSVFSTDDFPGLASSTLMQVLDFDDGPGLEGAARTLYRAAVAAVLNASHPGVAYPLSNKQVRTAVETIIVAPARDEMLALAADLDADNNLGCPLN